jgi:hypothetical protein
MSNYPLELSQEERIDLKEKLQLIAQWYFTGEVLVSTSCGICNALSTAFGDDSIYYTRMDSLLWEFQRYASFGVYTDSYEEWEGRAYMCLILAEYLDTTIDLKSSEILRKARVLLPDGSYQYDIDDWSYYICDCIRMIERDVDCTENTRRNCMNLRWYISERIEGSFNLEDWIVYKGFSTYKEIKANPQKMQQTRYNMIDDMILYYESKGD